MADHLIVDGHLFLLSPLMTVLDESSAILIFFSLARREPRYQLDALPAACKQYCTCNAFFGGFLFLTSMIIGSEIWEERF